MIQVNLRISEYFLAQIDEAAKQDCTTRSELIRTDVYWYLMPHHRNREQSEEDYIFETIRHRRAIAANNKWFKEHSHEIDAYDS